MELNRHFFMRLHDMELRTGAALSLVMISHVQKDLRHEDPGYVPKYKCQDWEEIQ
jgi:hypothetical protein